MLQMFDKLHQVFVDNNLHHVNSNKVLICEVYAIAQNVADCLLRSDSSTP